MLYVVRRNHLNVLVFFSRIFSAVDDVYCMFVGMLENLPQLRQTYGLSKLVNEVVLITEMYRVLRDRGPYSADQVIQDLVGAFAFVLYDNKAKKLLVACVSALCFERSSSNVYILPQNAMSLLRNY